MIYIYIIYLSLSIDRYTQLCNPTAGSRFQGSVPVFRASRKNGAPLPDPEIETQQSLLLGIYPRV